jgi:hypothetical protein
MKILHPRLLFALATLVFFTLPDMAQQPQQMLQHHVRPAVQSGQAAKTGSLPPEQRMNLSIVLPLRNQSKLASLLSRLYDPSSPDYHHFLSVDQFTGQFGPTVADYNAVVKFAQANGFTVTGTPANRLIVPIRGSVAQIEKAFNVRMNNYRHPTEQRTFYSADREPSLNLSVPVQHIAGLNNYSIPRPMVRKLAATQGAAKAAVVGSGPSGAYLSSDMRAAYYGGSTLTGNGQTVGLVQFDGYDISDVTSSFDGTATASTNGSNYVLSYTPTADGVTYTVPINNVLLDGTSGASVSGDDAEETLDIVQAIGMAPGLSQVRVYIGYSDLDILNAVASENLAQQVSISWTWSPDDPSTDDFMFQEFAAQGQSVFVASGDDGAFDPLQDYSYPAEDAWVTTVGGTSLVTNGAAGSWGSETAWSLSGGGISPDGIPIPGWQAGVSNSSNGGSTTLRNVPDVAAEADTDNYDCNMGVCQGIWGGTSFAAPRWAGFMALVNQQAITAGNPTVGFINPAIYAIGEGSTYDVSFHDITSGNNGATLYLATDPISLPGFNAVPGYDLISGWGSPAGQGLIDALAPPASVGFQLSTSPSNLTINPGASGSTTITVQDVGGFTGSVNLSVSGLPSGVTASLGTNPTSGNSVLTLTVSSSALRGSYPVTITGTSGSVTATTSLALAVNAPGFTIDPYPGTMWINVGNSGTNTIVVTDYAGFTGNVSLAVTSPLPSGVTASWAANPTTGTSALTLTASDSATPVTTMVTITGTSGSLTATTTLALTVFGAEFNLNISPYPYTIAQGSSATATVTVVPLGKFSGSIALNTLELPPGVTATFNPNPTTTGTSVLTMTASSTAPLGTSVVCINGSSTYSGACDQFQQTVTAAPVATFTVGVSPAFLTLTPGASGAVNVTVNDVNGFTGSVSLAVPNPPKGVTASFSTNPTTGGSVLTLTANTTTAPAGLYNVGIVGVSGNQTIVATLYLTVNPAPSYTLGASPASLTLAQGASVPDTITVTPQTGFTGNVTLSAPSLPSGLTASFGTNPTSGTSVVTLTADCTVHPGSYLAIIAGSAGANVITTPLALTVSSSASCAAVSTTTALSINPSGGSLTAGAPYSLTAIVSPTSGSTTPTGNVVFTIGSSTQTTALNSSGVATYAGTAPATAGPLSLSAAYQGTTAFLASTSNILSETVILPKTTPTVVVTPSASSITTTQPFTVTIAVSGGSGYPTPTGSVTLTSGSFSSAAVALSSGSASISVPAGSLTTGNDTLTASYAPDPASSSIYNSASGTSSTVTVSLPPKTTPTVTVTPSASSITTTQALTVTVAVSGGSGNPTPTGTVTLSSGSYSSTVALSSGSASISVPAGSLTTGNDTLTATYTPDPASSSTYNSATGTSPTVTVTVITNPVPTMSGISPAFTSAGGAAFTLTVSGTGFVSGSTVYWGTTALTTTYVSATQLTAQIAAADIATAGTTEVSVQSPNPGGGISNAMQFEVDSAGSSATAPTFTSVTATVAAGSTASYPVTLPSAVTSASVTCLNLPAGASCSYSSTSGAVTITTSSTTPVGTYQVTIIFSETVSGAATAGILLPILLLPLVLLKRKMTTRGVWFSAGLGLVLLVAAAFSVGCGGGGAGGTITTPTNPTHQATSSASVNLTVH